MESLCEICSEYVANNISEFEEMLLLGLSSGSLLKIAMHSNVNNLLHLENMLYVGPNLHTLTTSQIVVNCRRLYSILLMQPVKFKSFLDTFEEFVLRSSDTAPPTLVNDTTLMEQSIDLLNCAINMKYEKFVDFDSIWKSHCELLTWSPSSLILKETTEDYRRKYFNHLFNETVLKCRKLYYRVITLKDLEESRKRSVKNSVAEQLNAYHLNLNKTISISVTDMSVVDSYRYDMRKKNGYEFLYSEKVNTWEDVSWDWTFFKYVNSIHLRNDNIALLLELYENTTITSYPINEIKLCGVQFVKPDATINNAKLKKIRDLSFESIETDYEMNVDILEMIFNVHSINSIYLINMENFCISHILEKFYEHIYHKNIRRIVTFKISGGTFFFLRIIKHYIHHIVSFCDIVEKFKLENLDSSNPITIDLIDIMFNLLWNKKLEYFSLCSTVILLPDLTSLLSTLLLTTNQAKNNPLDLRSIKLKDISFVTSIPNMIFLNQHIFQDPHKSGLIGVVTEERATGLFTSLEIFKIFDLPTESLEQRINRIQNYRFEIFGAGKDKSKPIRISHQDSRQQSIEVKTEMSSIAVSQISWIIKRFQGMEEIILEKLTLKPIDMNTLKFLFFIFSNMKTIIAGQLNSGNLDMAALLLLLQNPFTVETLKISGIDLNIASMETINHLFLKEVQSSLNNLILTNCNIIMPLTLMKTFNDNLVDKISQIKIFCLDGNVRLGNQFLYILTKSINENTRKLETSRNSDNVLPKRMAPNITLFSLQLIAANDLAVHRLVQELVNSKIRIQCLRIGQPCLAEYHKEVIENFVFETDVINNIMFTDI
ncbi:hypothetical protein SNEBB_004078 [Seison nebaliae]|nr:hypothetical protein SNEBB_004078 [Seison nebaliae]